MNIWIVLLLLLLVCGGVGFALHSGVSLGTIVVFVIIVALLGGGSYWWRGRSRGPRDLPPGPPL